MEINVDDNGATIVAQKGRWKIIKRPGPPTDGCEASCEAFAECVASWINFWVATTAWSKNRSDILISYNIKTFRFSDCPSWKEIHTRHPTIAKWFLREVRRYAFSEYFGEKHSPNED